MMKTAVTTRSFNNSRDNANLNERRLTPAVLRQQGIRRLFSLVMHDDARGAEGMPLIVPDIQVGGRARDVLFACSMANNVYAWDANDGTPLWTRNLGNPVRGSRDIDAYLINDHWGVLSTPVIDLDVGCCTAWRGRRRTGPRPRRRSTSTRSAWPTARRRARRSAWRASPTRRAEGVLCNGSTPHAGSSAAPSR